MTRVLIIDDDMLLIARLAEQLEAQGYQVFRASDLRQAEHMASEHTPDIMLIDVAMQQGTGWQFLERYGIRLPIIVISGSGLEEDVVRGLDAGAADYIAKPFRTAELLARMRRISRPADTERAPIIENTPSIDDPVDRLRRASVEQQRPIDADLRSRARPNLGERPPDLPPARRTREEEKPSVFMTPEEEQQLFLQPNESDEELRYEQVAVLSLGQRLKNSRQRRQITLVQAELDTKLRMYYIQAMEEEKFSLLPSGTANEDMLRSYATYLGLDVPEAMEEYRSRHFHAPVLPLAALGGSLPIRQTPRWLTTAVAIVLALAIGFGGLWFADPRGITSLAGRARALVIPPTATETPIPSVVPTATATLSPLPTATATATPSPAPTVVVTLTATRRP